MKIITRIKGGLGNQLFCYAAARRLAVVNNVPLKLDIVSGFKWDSQFKRKYLLDVFNIKAEAANRRESYTCPGGRIHRYLKKKVNVLKAFENRSYLVEQSIMNFDPNILAIKPKNTLYMDGYWHSEKYFKDIEDIIRNDLVMRAPHDGALLDEANQIIHEKNSVCIGIRLFQDVKQGGVHTVLSRDYYLRAAKKINELLDNPHFFIFCNDETWMKQHMRLPYQHTFITAKPEDERAHEDLWLMTLCKHFIISNSTYYWWGAWLSNNEHKIVIAPDRGFHNKDIIPCDWLVINVEE
jgi:hypothetical protein